MKKNFLLFAAFTGFALPLAAAAQSMQPGEWEFKSTLTSPMIPAPQSNTSKQCLSKEDAEDPTRFSSNKDMQGCKVKPGAKTADSYKWEIACPEQGVNGTGIVRYTRTTMTADIKMLISMPGQKSEMNTKVVGRFLGPCAAK